MYVALRPEQRDALERYFDSVRDFRVGIERVEAAVVAEEAVVTYTRTDDFVDVETGKPSTSRCASPRRCVASTAAGASRPRVERRRVVRLAASASGSPRDHTKRLAALGYTVTLAKHAA
jgi:hypothetical protein